MRYISRDTTLYPQGTSGRACAAHSVCAKSLIRVDVIPSPSERQRRVIVSSRPATNNSGNNMIVPWQPVHLHFTNLEACQYSQSSWGVDGTAYDTRRG